MKTKIEYKVIAQDSVHNLNTAVNQLIAEGWRPIGSHTICQVFQQNRYRGDQHIDTIFENEVSQTLIREIEP